MIGQVVKQYEVLESLGRGGMGEVYRARDTRLDRPVALKFLSKDAVADPERRRRFLQEARAASAVNHPSIAQIYDVDEAGDLVFLAMELVDGKTIRSLIQGRELDLLGALEVAVQVGSGLAKAHEAGIVHRDIKPENVMLTPDGHAKILDFGLAKLLQPSGAAASGDEVSHMETLARTQAGMVMGTLRYMSPEQARGQAVDHRSDLFSLGIVAYEMVTGQVPFAGASALDTLHAIAFEETRPITALRANLPPSLQRVLSRCLRKRPDDRYPDARELVADLKTVQREVESGISGHEPLAAKLRAQLASLGEHEPRQWLVPALVGGALVLLAALFVLWRGDSIFLLLLFGFIGLQVYRRLRNRRFHLLRTFTAKVAKMPEVRLAAVDGQRITIVADKALAKTYVANALAHAVNAKMLLGEPFSVVVRDDATPEEVRALLASPGVLHVRDDALGK